MAECKNLANCSFVGCCNEFHKDDSAKGFINIYCKGAKMNDCIRLKLSAKFGKEKVPKNMMPNGLPLPGTNKDTWAEEAKKYYEYI